MSDYGDAIPIFDEVAGENGEPVPTVGGVRLDGDQTEALEAAAEGFARAAKAIGEHHGHRNPEVRLYERLAELLDNSQPGGTANAAETANPPENIDDIDGVTQAKRMLDYLSMSTKEKAQESRSALSEGEVNPSHMAHAESQGMAEAYSAAREIIGAIPFRTVNTQITYEPERPERGEAPDDRNINDISVSERCETCGWSPAAIIKTDEQWECYNCGAEQ
jgi:hypothetical protein